MERRERRKVNMTGLPAQSFESSIEHVGLFVERKKLAFVTA